MIAGIKLKLSCVSPVNTVQSYMMVRAKARQETMIIIIFITQIQLKLPQELYKILTGNE